MNINRAAEWCKETDKPIGYLGDPENNKYIINDLGLSIIEVGAPECFRCSPLSVAELIRDDWGPWKPRREHFRYAKAISLMTTGKTILCGGFQAYEFSIDSYGVMWRKDSDGPGSTGTFNMPADMIKATTWYVKE